MRWLAALLFLPAIAMAAPPDTIRMCIQDYQNMAFVDCYNFRKQPVTVTEPPSLTGGIKEQVVQVPASPTPVPAQFATVPGCMGASVTYVEVPTTLDGPGIHNVWVCWLWSQDGVFSDASNTLTPGDKKPTPPSLQ